jgi:Ca-activated chloride channel family protein
VEGVLMKKAWLMVRGKGVSRIALLSALLLLAAAAPSQSLRAETSKSKSQDSERPTGGQIQVPSRPTEPLFKGKQGNQKTEIHFDPATRTVTIKLLVQDPNGYFIPNVRRENFVVYENGVRQQNATVDVEHAPVSLGLLMEFGGHSPGLNRDLGEEVSRACQHAVDEVGQDDSLALWKYNDSVQNLSAFTRDKVALETLCLRLGTPELSETNLYDAVIFTLGQSHPVAGRKAILLISSGVDTFSKASYQDALKAVQASDTPIYVLGLVQALRQAAELHAHAGPGVRIDWANAEKTLEELARVSGARAYVPENTLDLAPIYDDMLENLKVRYVITYTSSSNLDMNSPRTVRVELIDPKTGGPLQIVDSNGKTVRAKIVVQDSYTPSSASAR